MAFDYNGAKQDGYSDVDILDNLKKTRPDFDYSGAMGDNYSVGEIAEHLNKTPPKQQLAQPPLNIPVRPISMPVLTSVPAVSTRTAIQPAPVTLPFAPYPNAPVPIIPNEHPPEKEWTKDD